MPLLHLALALVVQSPAEGVEPPRSLMLRPLSILTAGFDFRY